MKIEMKTNEISSKVLSKVKSPFSFPPLNMKRILEDNSEIRQKLSKWFVWVSPWIRCNSLRQTSISPEINLNIFLLVVVIRGINTIKQNIVVQAFEMLHQKLPPNFCNFTFIYYNAADLHIYCPHMT